MVLQKHIRWMKCLNLYQISEVVFFILIGVACSISSLSMAVFGNWLAGDTGCVWITPIPFVVIDVRSVCFDVTVIDCGCSGGGGCCCCCGGGDDDDVCSSIVWCSSKWSVAVTVRISLPASSSVAISILMPLCLANNFNNSIASRASRFSCKNLFHSIAYAHRVFSMKHLLSCISLFAFPFPVARLQHITTDKRFSPFKAFNATIP